jgi:hypothetical protein
VKGILHLLLPLALANTAVWAADEVTDWNRIMFRAVLVPPAASGVVATRVAAIVQASVFDAVNGIERRYAPIHVTPAAPPGASARAAAVQAAYASLVRLYPSQSATFDTLRAASLAAISSGPAAEPSESITSGVAWGQAVADEIWAWRSTDGFTSPLPFIDGTLPGEWRPTPPGNLPFAGTQFAAMTPWSIQSPSQFRPAGPPALTSLQYTQDFNEVKTMGSLSSFTRTSDQTVYSLFWNASNAPYFWDTIAIQVATARHLTLSETARLLALVNIAMADAAIGCWDAKYFSHFWRPITAIRLADTDGNPATEVDTTWNALFATPAHPDYPSGHSCVSGAAGRVLSNYFGDDTPFSIASDVMIWTTRYFSSFTAALEEVKNARVFAGIHFRTACNDGQTLGIGVADYVLGHSLLPVNGNPQGQVQH